MADNGCSHAVKSQAGRPAPIARSSGSSAQTTARVAAIVVARFGMVADETESKKPARE